MRVLNQTRSVHGLTMGMDKTGREYLSFVVKGTFAFPGFLRHAETGQGNDGPLVMADEFTGEPGFSATLSLGNRLRLPQGGAATSSCKRRPTVPGRRARRAGGAWASMWAAGRAARRRGPT